MILSRNSCTLNIVHCEHIAALELTINIHERKLIQIVYLITIDIIFECIRHIESETTVIDIEVAPYNSTLILLSEVNFKNVFAVERAIEDHRCLNCVIILEIVLLTGPVTMIQWCV